VSGDGVASSLVSAKPSTVPGAPTSVVAVAGDGEVSVSWSAPVDDGGRPVLGYAVSASPGGGSCESSSLSCVVSGLTNGVEYSFSVVASNVSGDGVASSLVSAKPSTVLFVHSFVDVPVDGWKGKAVSWMQLSAVTQGCSEIEFCPDAEMTREQQVTFLWRYAGSPTPSGPSPFSDVPAGRYFTDAIAWAFENEITTGIGNNLFGTGQPVTRAQAVTFLHRQAGEASTSGSMPFSDVPPGRFYTNAVAWAFENDITTGKSPTVFAPDDPVARVEFAAFLSRFDGIAG